MSHDHHGTTAGQYRGSGYATAATPIYPRVEIACSEAAEFVPKATRPANMPCPPDAEVFEAVKRIYARIDELGERLTTLHKRAEPIMRPEVMCATQGGNPPQAAPPRSPHVHELNAIANKLAFAADRVAEILERLEI